MYVHICAYNWSVSDPGSSQYFTGTTVAEAREVYSGLPIQLVYNLIKQFEPDYKAFGYPLPFEWLGIQPVDLDEHQTLKVYTDAFSFHDFTPLI